MTSIYHVSDLHFGRASMPEVIDVIEEQIRTSGYDVVAISGDLSQRARSGEFLRARAFIRDAGKFSKVIVVPGNHDVRWWKAPLGFGDTADITRHYRRYISDDLNPVLRVPGVTIVGLNSSQGVLGSTLTWRMRDISIIGYISARQIDHAAAEFEKSPPDDCRVIMLHHNPVKGELSQRHGLRNTSRVLGAFATLGVSVVLCGHDHQEAIHYIEHTRRGTIISTAGTVSSRLRGGRPGSVNIIDISESSIVVTTHIWSSEHGLFRQGPSREFER